MVCDEKQTFETVVLLESLTSHILNFTYDELDHNDFTQTYMTLKDYWNGLKLVVHKYVKQYKICQQRNRQVVKYASLHFHACEHLCNPHQWI